MTQISLRAYNQEIDRLIGQGQLEEAIAHCRYILKRFPKHLDTYRLLGKACLEGQRYAEAADIFQRVLAVVPDDYVANLGMSVIRENEGNLDAGIWHMERAFEVQPSNRVVQDELGRLYKRRDGVAPQKIRLTRGALVRMYERGSLFSQAIAEARATLAEEPERIDIEVILARIYHHLGQTVEAAAAASRLVGTLPFCYEANRVLADILPETPRAEDTPVYQQNLEALDPYFAFISADAPTPDKVADSAVMLEYLDWLPARPPAPEAPEPEMLPVLPAAEESLPTWPGIPSFGSEAAAEEAPDENESVLAEEQEAEAVKGLSSESAPFIPSEEGKTAERPLSAAPFTLPEESEAAEGPSSESAPFIPSEEGKTAERPLSAAPFTLPEESEAEEEPVSVSTSFTLPEEGEPAEEPPSESTSFTLPEENEPVEEPPSEFTPFTLPEEGGAAAEPSSESTPFTLSEESELPEFPLTQGMATSPFLPESENVSGWIQTPDWFAGTDEVQDESGEKLPFEASAAEEAADAGTPEWLRDLEPESMEPSWLQDDEDEQVSIPEWLRESFVTPEESAEDTAKIKLPPKNSAGETSVETPHAAETASESRLEPAAEERATLPIQADEPNDIDAALAWLESLAARQSTEPDPTIAEGGPGREPRQEVQPHPGAGAEEFSEPYLGGGSFREGEPATPTGGWVEDSGEDFGSESGVEDTQKIKTSPKTAPLESAGEALPEWMRSILDAEDAFVNEGNEPQESEVTEPQPGGPDDLWASDENFEEITLSRITREQEELSGAEANLTGAWPDWMQNESWIAENVETPPEEPSETGPEQPGETEPEPPLPQWLQNLDRAEENAPEVEETEQTPVEVAATLPAEEPVSETQELYEKAQEALQRDDLKAAVEQYGLLIAANERLPEIIADLKKAVSQHPDDLSLWQTLGDAYFRSDCLQDALEAYNRAEELLR